MTGEPGAHAGPATEQLVKATPPRELPPGPEDPVDEAIRLLAQVMEITREATAALDDDDIDAALDLLEGREPIFDEAGALFARLSAHRETLPGDADPVPDPAALDDLLARAAELAASDRQLARRLGSAREKVDSALSETRARAAATSSYSAPGSPHRIDVRG